ncbi:MAG: AgmX/PglI C-terminal domain-containing protein [Gammaproteobacteria bacterium]
MAAATPTTTYYRLFELPWSLSSEQEQQYRQILLRTVGGVMILALLLSILPLPQTDPDDVKEIPKRFAKLILERKAPPPPPPVVVKEEPEKVVKDDPKPEKVVKKEPEPEPVIDKVEQARDNAKVAGLLPFADELADLRDNKTLDKLNQDKQLLGGVEGDAPRAERSLITSKAGRASGGINTAALSRNTGGSGLAGRSTTQVASNAADFGAGGGTARRTGSSNKASRSREEIEMVFDRNKGAIYTLYNRALRKDPSLEGKLVLRLTIAPTGAVTFCEVVSSELGDSELERKLVQRILLFRFDAKDVEAITTTKPIDFFPA